MLNYSNGKGSSENSRFQNGKAGFAGLFESYFPESGVSGKHLNAATRLILDLSEFKAALLVLCQ